MPAKKFENITFLERIPKHILGEIIGHLQFDGSVETGKNSRGFYFYSKDFEHVRRFKELINKYFKCGSCIKKRGSKFIVSGYSAQIVKWLNNSFEFKSNTWKVPNFVINGSDKVKCSYLRSFFDDDGGLSRTNSNGNYVLIRGTSVNKGGILNLQGLLMSLDVSSKIMKRSAAGFNKDGVYYRIQINGFENLQKFNKKIGFSLSRKQRLLDNYLCSNHNYPEEIIKKILETRKEMCIGSRKLSKMFNIHRGTIQHWIDGSRRANIHKLVMLHA